jgi:hypothetical protein
MLNFCKNDVRILKWIKSILERISKWQKEDLVTAKSQINRYFTFDLWYNTWYRLVLQDQKNSDRRIILDLCDHDYYEQHIDRYMKYNN